MAFGVWAQPNTVLIDRAGPTVDRVRGERGWSTDGARCLVEALPGGR